LVAAVSEYSTNKLKINDVFFSVFDVRSHIKNVSVYCIGCIVASFIEFDSILSHPFDEIFNQHVLMKTVDQ
jgi:hypothetical protein